MGSSPRASHRSSASIFSEEYQDEVKRFIENAKKYARNPDMIICPCRICKNLRPQNDEMLYEHLVINGFDPLYKVWVLHGEQPSASEYIGECEHQYARKIYDDMSIFDDGGPMPANKVDEIYVKKFEEIEAPLYATCTKYTVLTSVISLYKHKVTNNISDKAFNELLELFKDMLPEDNKLPKSLYLVRKFLKDFDLGYEKIDACVNDCCLFTKENKHRNMCPKCHSSRWKRDRKTKKIQKGVPAKTLRYFPLIPRLRMMFLSPEKVGKLKWHSTHHSQDGMMRHPMDSFVWNFIDKKWPDFALDPRNLRLGLAADGFNPFNNLSSTYSCWPVVLTIYNLSPDLCMSQENLMLTLLIPGRKQPGNDIDVYLEPLVDELKELWNNGVNVFDSSTESLFNLKAILLWTINDFPAYGNLAGCKTKGEFPCPKCGPNTSSVWLPWSNKMVYMDHRRFLEPTHMYRKKASWFDGKEEKRRAPKPLTGKDIVCSLKDFHNQWGKGKSKSEQGRKRKRAIDKRENDKSLHMWKKKSIFFNLPYWEELPLRHNLDVMHIEKNICESLMGTLLDNKGKSKDGLEARRDLELMGIRKDLHPQQRGSKFYLPTTPHTLSKAEKKIFCKRLFDLKLPDGYSSNIGNCINVEECKIIGLKSHDYHILMQQLLSVAIRGLLPQGPRTAIFRLCSFFNELCQRVIDKNRLEVLEEDIADTLCMLEMYFPPSFFDIMVHLTIHLGQEARLCGPVQYRWMYPFERFQKVLKRYVRNNARPEGCIAESYLVDECVRFCSNYIQQAKIFGTKYSRNEEFEGGSILEGRPISKGEPQELSDEMRKVVHLYVLLNTADVEPYIEEHLKELKHLNKRLVQKNNLLQKRHLETFSEWILDKVNTQTRMVSNTLKWLVRGPRHFAMSYSGYVINGKRFHTTEVEKATQDYGVYLEAKTICRSSAKDTTQVVANVQYYGVIKKILLLDYNAFRLPVFQCDWANIVSGVKKEEGFTLVNLHEGLSKFEKDPFILASQAKQVFYSRDNEASNWYVVMKTPPRGFHDLATFDENVYISFAPQDVSQLDLNNREKDVSDVREDIEGTLV